MDLQETLFRIRRKKMRNRQLLRAPQAGRLLAIKCLFGGLLFLGISCERHANVSSNFVSGQDAIKKKIIFGVHDMAYMDSLPKSLLSNHERAIYYMSLLDSLDKYDPLGDTTSCTLSWYGEYSFDTTSWSKIAATSTQQNKIKDVAECSDRYKLIWFVHLSLKGDSVDTTKYPYMVYGGKTIVSYDRLLISDDPTGNHFHGIKLYKDYYSKIKAIYWTAVREEMSIEKITVALSSEGFLWKRAKARE